jgi:hypothetical protein
VSAASRAVPLSGVLITVGVAVVLLVGRASEGPEDAALVGTWVGHASCDEVEEPRPWCRMVVLVLRGDRTCHVAAWPVGRREAVPRYLLEAPCPTVRGTWEPRRWDIRLVLEPRASWPDGLLLVLDENPLHLEARPDEDRLTRRGWTASGRRCTWHLRRAEAEVIVPFEPALPEETLADTTRADALLPPMRPREILDDRTPRLVRPVEGQVHEGLVVEYVLRYEGPWSRGDARVTVDGIKAWPERTGRFSVTRSFPRAGPVRSEIRCVVEGRPETERILTVAYAVRRSAAEDAAYEAAAEAIDALGPDVEWLEMWEYLRYDDMRLWRPMLRLMTRTRDLQVRRVIASWLGNRAVVDAVPTLLDLVESEHLGYWGFAAVQSIVGEGRTGGLLEGCEYGFVDPDVEEVRGAFAQEEELIRERLSQPKDD